MLEAIAVGMALLSVYLLQREHIANFPVTIVVAAIYVHICYQSGVYADMLINVYFAFAALLGWLSWNNRPMDEQLPVSFLSKRQLLLLVPITLALWACIAAALKYFTDTDVYLLNGLNASLGIVAQVLVIRKKIENWYFWMLTNVVSVPLYFSKELYLTSLLWLIMFGFSTAGLISWLRKHRALAVFAR
jgi:nicotinamide mononucleotide transporter